MEEKLPGERSAGGLTAPILPERPAFLPTKREQIAAFAVYGLAYLYVRNLWSLFDDSPRHRLWLLIFFAGFVALAELLHRGVRRRGESWVWLGCACVCLASLLLGRGRAWSELLADWGDCTVLFLHVFAVWWLLSRSGRLSQGVSGPLLPLDALQGFVLIPFRHFFLRVRTAFYTLTHLRGGRTPGASALGFSALALAVAAGLFAMAAGLLMRADSGFASLLEQAAELIRLDPDGLFVIRLTFSLPVGAYLFGLLAGTARTQPETLRSRGAGVCAALQRLRRVPGGVWCALVGVFCLFYAVFFAVQFRYLFGAFTRTLPEGFIVSQYAREGFFELCKVMAVNFVLLWLALRSARQPLRNTRALLILALVLLAESLLFAVVAASKLLLYIDCFGFTPKRLVSSWLVCVLACGCVCAALRLLREKRTFRAWFFFSAVTAALLMLY